MMKTKPLRAAVCLIVPLVLIALSLLPAFAAEKNYVNPDTGFKSVIIDDLDLLKDAEEGRLIARMKPLTEYGNVAFWTTEEYASNEIDQARLKRKELFGYESAAVFVINMNIRKLTIQSYGAINESLTDSYARSITNNVSSYATKKNYYSCAENAFMQMFEVVEGRHISEPMKITGYVVLACMGGLIIALAVAFSKKSNPLLQGEMDDLTKFMAYGRMKNVPQVKFVSSTVAHREPVRSISTGGGSSCSSCSSGSSCSSCSSGSSCSSCGGGGCGSGGSSSF